MHLCKICNRAEPEVSFGIHRSRKSGLQSYCRECKKHVNSLHYSENKSYYQLKARSWERKQRLQINKFLLLLKSAPCTDCNQHFPPMAMDFDHIRGEKKFNISEAWKRNFDLVKEELAKCELVCSNCHRVRTASRIIGVSSKGKTQLSESWYAGSIPATLANTRMVRIHRGV